MRPELKQYVRFGLCVGTPCYSSVLLSDRFLNSVTYPYKIGNLLALLETPLISRFASREFCFMWTSRFSNLSFLYFSVGHFIWRPSSSRSSRGLRYLGKKFFQVSYATCAFYKLRHLLLLRTQLSLLISLSKASRAVFILSPKSSLSFTRSFLNSSFNLVKSFDIFTMVMKQSSTTRHELGNSDERRWDSRCMSKWMPITFDPRL